MEATRLRLREVDLDVYVANVRNTASGGEKKSAARDV